MCNLVFYTYNLEGLPNVGYFNLSLPGEEALELKLCWSIDWSGGAFLEVAEPRSAEYWF